MKCSDMTCRYLEMPFVLLLGRDPENAPRLWNILPRQLETLCCRDDTAASVHYQWSVPQIFAILKDYLVTENRLKEVKFKIQERLDDSDYLKGGSLKKVILKLQELDWPETSKATLKDVCSEFGVECYISYNPKILLASPSCSDNLENSE
jgi:hypothetical protein